MAIEVPKIQDEVAQFLKRFREENTFASRAARDKFLDAMKRLPSDKKVEFIAAYLNSPTASGAAASAMVKAVEEARGQVAEEVLASALKNYGRRLSDADKRALIDSVRYSANEATAAAIAALAKEAGVAVSGPVQQALTTRVGLTFRPVSERPSGERSIEMVPTVRLPGRTELPAERGSVQFTGQEVWFSPEDKKEENPIRVGMKLDREHRDDLEKEKERVRRQLELVRIKAGAMLVGGERQKGLEDLLSRKESQYGVKTPDVGRLRDLEIELAYIENSLKRGMIGGFVPVSPNAGLKRVKVKVKKEVMRGRGKKRGPVIEVVEESVYVPKEVVGPRGSVESVVAAATRFRNAVRSNMAKEFSRRGIDRGRMVEAAQFWGLLTKDPKLKIPEQYKEDVKLYAEVRRKAELEAKAATPRSGTTRIAKGAEFQKGAESRAFRKAMKGGPARVREILIAGNVKKVGDNLENILPVDEDELKEFLASGFMDQMAAAQKLYKSLPLERRQELVEDLADSFYGPFKWRVGPSGVAVGEESVRADSKAVTMMTQKPEMYPRLSASQRMGGARRSDEPSPSWVNLAIYNAPDNKKKPKQQRLASAVYLNPDWISATFGTEVLRNVIARKVARGAAAAAETSITRFDLAEVADPFGEEAGIAAADVPVTMFARALDAWNKDTFRQRRENVTLAPLILVGKGADRKLVTADSPEGKRFLIQNNASAYLYGDSTLHSFRAAKKNEKALIDLAEEMVVEDLVGEGFDPIGDPKLFNQKVEELLPLRVNVLLLDGPLVSQNFIDAAGLYNERLRSKTVAPKQAAAGGFKAEPIRAAPKSDDAVRAEAANRLHERYAEKVERSLRPPPPLSEFVKAVEARARSYEGTTLYPGFRSAKAIKARATALYNDAVRKYSETYDSLFKAAAENYEADLKEEERRLRQARGVIGFKRTKEQAEQVRQERKLLEAQERASEKELEAAREAGERQLRELLARERGVSRRDPTKEGKLPFILSEEKTPETEIAALQQEKRIKGSAFPGFKEKRLRKLLAQQRIAIQKKGMSGLGFGFGGYDLGSQIAGVAVGGLVVFSLFKAIQAGLKKD